MNEFFKENRKAILIGLITTVVFMYILQPLIDFTVGSVIYIGSIVSESYIDLLYSQVAHLEIMSFGFFFYFLIFTMLIGISLVAIYQVWNRHKTNKKEDTSAKSITKQKVFSTVLLLSSVIYFTVQMSTKLYQLSLISSFKQHLTIIAPYIDDQKEELILSKWSLMQNHKDFEGVYSIIKSEADKNKIILPNNTIYSLTSF